MLSSGTISQKKDITLHLHNMYIKLYIYILTYTYIYGRCTVIHNMHIYINIILYIYTNFIQTPQGTH